MQKIYLRFVFSLLLFCGVFFNPAKALTLSPKATIYLVTCGPNQIELYSAFGHTAVRVQDPGNGIDLIFNYGVFNFNQPNFYLNFAKGNLLYQLAVYDYDRFVYNYKVEERSVHLQELNFNAAEKQAYFNFLETNALPQNKEYYYDYFFDNCATRPRDGMQQAMKTLNQTIAWDTSYAKQPLSIRDLCEQFLYYQPWGDLGIDLCLGLPMDKQATALEYTFLPEYLEQAVAGAILVTDSGTKPLLKQTILVNEETFVAERPFFTPQVAFGLLLVIGVLLSFLEFKFNVSTLWFDKLLFTIVGLVGWLLFILWFATDHAAAARNMNLLWAIPLYFPFVLFLKNKGGGFSLFIMRFSFLVQLIALAGWYFWPQDLHPGMLPLCALLMWRSFWRVYVANKKSAIIA